MNIHDYPYNESLLQWIWQNAEFDPQHLKSECGKKVSIIDPGRQNHGEGPDFSGCVIRIDDAKLHGDVEIHIVPKGWADHHHHNAKSYNRVILHVVYDYGSVKREFPAVRPDGTEPPLLILKPHLEKPLQDLFEQQNRAPLRCAGNIQFINQNAFEEQIEAAHHAYFEYKVQFLLSRFRSDLPVSKAWLHLLTAGLFHTLGIPTNRDEMEQLHELICEKSIPSSSLSDFKTRLSNLAFSSEKGSTISWNHTGMRPASRPRRRVAQAAYFAFIINGMDFKAFLAPDLSGWDRIVESLPENDRPGRQMLRILNQTIYLPASYLLGDLLFSSQLKANAYQAWRSIRGGVPQEVTEPFKKSGFELNSNTRKPGLAHQLKRYCRPGQCHKCKVFKKAISS